MPDLSVTKCYNTLLQNLISANCRHLVLVNTTEAGDSNSVHCLMFTWNVAANLPFGFIAAIDELI